MAKRFEARETPGEPLSRRIEQAAAAAPQGGFVPAGAVGRRMRRRLGELKDLCARVAQLTQGEQTPPAAEWLLDNWYMAQQEGSGAARAFRRRGRLPAGRGKEPRVLTLAGAAVEAGTLTREGMEETVETVQRVSPLDEEELAVFIPALKGALIGQLVEASRELVCCLEKKTGCTPGSFETLGRRFERIFTSLRFLAGANLGALLERASLVEQLLCQDPSGTYPEMEEESRFRYRQAVCRLAKHYGLTERETACRVLELAGQGSGRKRHVGWYLFQEPMGRRERTRQGTGYVAAVVLPTLFITLLTAFALEDLGVVLLLLLPVSDLVKNLVDFLAVRLFRPRYVFRMALKGGIPKEGKTLCVITALLTGERSGEELAGLLERYYLANRDSGKNLLFGLLADLPDSDLPMGSAAGAWVSAAAEAVEALGRKYGGGFYLFFREPVFQSTDERYMGWERKRGALLELCRALRERPSGTKVLVPERGELGDVRYVITLDADTRLNVGTARKLVGAMLHPLNTPEIDPRRRIVTRGYGVLQPRIGVELEAANKSPFSRVFAGQGGVDPYGSAASDVYHDLFDQGTYTGKGIFDVDAFLACLDGRFPTGRILSHDLLEGAYLHAGLIGDVELSDGFPYKVTSYFTRLHRWVRGDWQLLAWLGRRVRDQWGDRYKNPIPPMARWKIFDNLRRSLSPVCTLLALVLGMCVSGRAFAAAATAAVLAAASNLLLSGAAAAFRFGKGLRRRYHSAIVAGLGGVVLQTLLQLLLLPYNAWTCFSAAVTALWRMGVSHRGLLAWVTAAAAERTLGGGVGAMYRKQWFSVAVGAVAMVRSILPAGAALGLLWALSPLCCWALSRPIEAQKTVSRADRAFLLHEGGLIWRYFAQHLREQDHWLPPDNVQEQPPLGEARRTSPTNIGFALLSVLAAVDLEFLSRKRAVELIGHMLDTLEQLPKWHGQLYNWYDTATAQPLAPRYVSTVDCGNLCGCLIALKEGLFQWGEAQLACRAAALYEAMDLSIFYDGERRLFYIGYDVESGRYTQGWYDLMASEARQTSYIALARGEVPLRHWRQLSRTLVKENNYTGMASWTGTMFEYFMPNLLLPCEPNSLISESLLFCLYVQRRAAARAGAPWGISESGFYAFDPGMSYQYKAHGVQSLGWKRGLDKELVVSPYSSFLALLLAPGAAADNLRRLRDMGMEGKYGLYEAVDLTPSRLTGGARWEIVRSYMAHHLGMSLVAIDNALTENIMSRRFLCDHSMAAYRELLQEKVPVEAAVSRPVRREAPEKVPPVPQSGFRRSGRGLSEGRPPCHILSNGSYTVICTASGITASSCGGAELTRSERYGACRPAGVSFFFRGADGAVHSFTPAPFFPESGEYGWCFTGSEAVWTAEWDGLHGESRARLGEENGELREASLLWQGEGRLEGEIICYLEPVLAQRRDYDAHPAFSKLALESRFLGNGVLFSRRGGRKGPAAYLAVCWDAPEAGFDTCRETALGRGGLRGLEQALSAPPAGRTGAVLDPCLLARFPVRLESGEHCRIRVALCTARPDQDALLGAQRLLRLPRNAPGTSWLDGTARGVGLSGEGIGKTFRLLEALLYPRPRKGTVSQQDLWPFGVSGDLPIAAVEPVEEGSVEKTFGLLSRHDLLSRCGFAFDLVFLLREGGDYRRPAHRKLMEQLRRMGIEGRLGQRGGVHLVDSARDGAQAIAAAAALVLAPGQEPEEGGGPCPAGERPGPFFLAHREVCRRWQEDGSFVFETGGALPPVGWSQMLANPAFGAMTDETGCGHMWYQNAHENPLTGWNNDPLEIGGSERLLWRQAEECCSVFADADGLPCTVTYAPGLARWEKSLARREIRTQVFVPWDIPARVILIEGAEGGQLIYRFRPQLAPEHSGGQYAVCTWRGEHMEIQNSWSRAYWPQTMLVAGTSLPVRQRRCADGVVELTWQAEGSFVLVVGCAASREEEQAVLALPRPNAARQALHAARERWARLTGQIRVETPCPRLDAYLNSWAPYQITACRMWGRSSRYQNGGAYGFRDQLQDSCAALYFAPRLAREQILRCCGRQFTQGDVLHWWHEGLGEDRISGVRTRISDDLLWLAYAVCVYIDHTGEDSILDECVPYLSAPPLARGERERYAAVTQSAGCGSVREHVLRALELALARGSGKHGLPLIGTGDWNDGLDRVGEKGRGESVWLGWFLAHVLERFAPLAGEEETSRRLLSAAEDYRAAAEEAWDGAWFLRGWYDDGTPLGSRDSRCCRIDSLAQSWAVPGGCRDREKLLTALRSALDQLWDKDHSLVKLFSPPFDGEGGEKPGYIAEYLPGVRENGGQYTHGAVWLALACLRSGLAEEGWGLLQTLLPSDRDGEIYRVEPYVLAGDVYANPAFPGRGGWSWYTGAAGWYYQAAVGELLGLKVRKGRLFVEPKLPESWPGYRVRWHCDRGELLIDVRRGEQKGRILDGAAAEEGVAIGELSGEHKLVVVI